MSMRSILHFNHDYPAVSELDYETFGQKIAAYIRSGSPKDLPHGVDVLWHGHHSDVQKELDKLKP